MSNVYTYEIVWPDMSSRMVYAESYTCKTNSVVFWKDDDVTFEAWFPIKYVHAIEE